MTNSNIFLSFGNKGSGQFSSGVEVATVTDVADLGKGKVKIKYPFRETSDGQNQQVEVGVMTGEKGQQPSLAVDDRVLVAHMQDNFESSFIIGFVYPQPAQ